MAAGTRRVARTSRSWIFWVVLVLLLLDAMTIGLQVVSTAGELVRLGGFAGAAWAGTDPT